MSIATDELRRQKIVSVRDEPSLEASGEAAHDRTSAQLSAGMNEQTSDGVSVGLWEQIFQRDNLFRALKRVESNGGGPGVDGRTTDDLRPYLSTHWLEIKADLDAGRYRPQPVKRVEIPKPDGGIRMLGIPTVLDRFLQQAILQGLTPLFEPKFSAHSYGFRPGRSAHGAIKAAHTYIREGYEWMVDIDLEKFFDRVNHDALMARVRRVVKDGRVNRLIHLYLVSGVIVNGVVMDVEEGTPQGGPLSPLLSNIMLDDLDKELEKRGHRFVRYADDCNIYVKTQRAGERVMASTKRFIERRLKLKVNERKSAVDRASRRKFLGFSFFKHKGEMFRRVATQALERLKNKLRELTRRTSGKPMEQIIRQITQYLTGWLNSFRLAETSSTFLEVDKWLRRRLRQIVWKRWKRPATQQRNLIALGVSPKTAHQTASSGKGYWHLAQSPALQQALNNTYWRQQGLLSISERYQQLRST